MLKDIFRSKSFGIIKLLTAAVLVFGLAACGGAGASGDSSGSNSDGNSGTTAYTPGNTLQISSAAELKAFADRVNNGEDFENWHVKLTNNIDLKNIAWAPIGHDYNKPFKGRFDGNGKAIFNLSVDDFIYEAAGLFGYILYGEVKNLGLENANIKGDDYIGGVAGHLDSSTVSNCYVTGPGKIIGDWSVGGIAGAVRMNSRISDCYVASTVKGNHYTGGVAGWVVDSGSSVSNCHAAGNVSGNAYIGGIAGVIEEGGSVANCYATGAIRGITYIGGVAGGVTNGAVINCYATGYLSGDNFVGGVAGYVSGSSSSVASCAALNPAIERTNDNPSKTAFGRVVGYVYGKTLNNNVAWNDMWVINANTTETITDNPYGINGQGISSENATKQNSYITYPLPWGVGNNNPWKWGGAGYRLPILYWQTIAQIPSSTPEHLQ